MQIRSPQTEEEFRRYYALRWEVLRKPWGQEMGSEQDEYETEEKTLHLMAVDQGEVVGVGRLHRVNAKIAQIRYMAVRPCREGLGIGGKLLKVLEEHALAEGYSRIILNARDEVVPFYQKGGYRVLRDGPTLFGSIRHRVMQKDLEPSDR